MLSAGREGLFQLGLQQQHQGQNQAAMHCFLSSLQGLTHVQNFPSLPNCLHQIAELFITEKNYGKALQFIQAEKMFYEVALIELTALQANTGSREGGALGPEGWVSQEDLCEQAAQAQDLERLAQLCIMTNRPHLALEYCGKATKIHQRAFGSEHPVTTRSLELLATVYAEIGKTEYSDSLRECVSTLPKSFPPCEAYSAKPSSATHTHPERHHELRHRKDPGSQPETPSQRVSGGAKAPTSILKRYGEGGAEADPPQRPRRGGRRVRFREPETTVHVYDSAQRRRPPLAVLTCLFLLLSALGVALYCAGRRRPQRVCEELRTSLALCLLQLRQLLWGCWVWFTMQ